MLCKAVSTNDWSKHPLLDPFRQVRDHLFIKDNLIFHGQACYIPPSLRQEMLQRCHRSHLATEAMLRRARGTIFWPGMSHDIRILVENCRACQLHSTRQRAEELICGEIPQHPFEIVHQDLMEWEGRNFLVTVDGYSDFFDITELGKRTTTVKVIKASKRLFGCFGRPAQLRTDCDPRYLSSQFKEFCKTWEVELRTSAPYHHSANGKGESAVKVAKRLLKKCLTQGGDLHLALLG